MALLTFGPDNPWLWRGRCPGHCRMSSCSSGLHPLDAGGTPSYSVVTNRSVSGHCLMSPGEQSPCLRTPDAKHAAPCLVPTRSAHHSVCFLSSGWEKRMPFSWSAEAETVIGLLTSPLLLSLKHVCIQRRDLVMESTF